MTYTESSFGFVNEMSRPNGIGYLRKEVKEGRMTLDELRKDVESYLDEELSEDAIEALREMLRS